MEDEELAPEEIAAIQAADGPEPGIPIDQLMEEMRLEDAENPPADASTSVCVPCLIARIVLLTLATAAIIALIVIQRREAAKTGASDA